MYTSYYDINALSVLQVRLPDQTEFFEPLKPDNLTHTADDSRETEIKARVVFSHGHWSGNSSSNDNKPVKVYSNIYCVVHMRTYKETYSVVVKR